MYIGTIRYNQKECLSLKVSFPAWFQNCCSRRLHSCLPVFPQPLRSLEGTLAVSSHGFCKIRQCFRVIGNVAGAVVIEGVYAIITANVHEGRIQDGEFIIGIRADERALFPEKVNAESIVHVGQFQHAHDRRKNIRLATKLIEFLRSAEQRRRIKDQWGMQVAQRHVIPFVERGTMVSYENEDRIVKPFLLRSHLHEFLDGPIHVFHNGEGTFFVPRLKIFWNDKRTVIAAAHDRCEKRFPLLMQAGEIGGGVFVQLVVRYAECAQDFFRRVVIF